LYWKRGILVEKAKRAYRKTSGVEVMGYKAIMVMISRKRWFS
jgi:hypothetical protein